MKHVALDRADERVKEFVASLRSDPDEKILELNGVAVLRVEPVAAEAETVDEQKLKAAILARRDQSRALNEDWIEVDRELWEKNPPSEG